MGMSIDEVIKELTSLIDCGILPISYEKYGKPFVTKESIEVAIETMRKYQKVTEIVTKWHNDLSFKTSMAMTEIEEVIEDGKID